MKRINIRSLVKELLEDKSLIVNYIELQDGGFDLSVRIDELNAKLKTSEEIDNFIDEPTHIPTAECPNIHYVCPYCYSKNIQSMYGTIKLDGSGDSTHYICEDCHKEFDILKN